MESSHVMVFGRLAQAVCRSPFASISVALLAFTFGFALYQFTSRFEAHTRGHSNAR
jgi:hypothetical protein